MIIFDWPLRILTYVCRKKNIRNLRLAGGMLSGWVSIAVNLLLCTAKFAVAIFSGSVAVAVDAVNNLSDAGSGVVTLIGFKLAAKPADEEHPFGHGRMEYISGLIAAIIIIAAGLNFLKESIGRIFSPAPVEITLNGALVLCGAILFKFWLAGFFHAVAKKTGSPAIRAQAIDSLSDLCITGAVLLSLLAGHFWDLHADGYAGTVVAILVVIAGIKLLREIIDPLLGTRPQKELVENLIRILKNCPGICGVHDCIIHSYGADLYFATAHAEVSKEGDLVSMHDLLEHAEVEVAKHLPVCLVLHCDPFNIEDPTVIFWRRQLENAVSALDERFKIYDFRCDIRQNDSPRIRFHLLVNRKDMARKKEISRHLETLLRRTDPKVLLDIEFVNAYV